MQRVKPKWKQSGLVLVCERCFKERIPDEDPEIAAQIGDFHLRNWLKDRLKADGRWGPIRAISTSCMDVCARGRVTVCIEPQRGETVVMAIDPVADREEFIVCSLSGLTRRRGRERRSACITHGGRAINEERVALTATSGNGSAGWKVEQLFISGGYNGCPGAVPPLG